MAYAAQGLRSIHELGAAGTAPGNVKKLYGYCSADDLATIAGSGYFNSATTLLSNGDLILVSAGIGSSNACNLLVVTSATGAATVTTAVAPDAA